MTRRSYLKYVGPGVLALAAAGIGYHFGRAPYPSGLSSTTSLAPLAADFEYAVQPSSARADFDYRTRERGIQYINATSEEEIVFRAIQQDDIGYSWSVDERIVAETREYSAMLPPGQHHIVLRTRENTILVELVSTPKKQTNASSELAHLWMVDGQEVSSQPQHSLRLDPGEHRVQLTVSDGTRSSDLEKTIDVPQGAEESFERTVLVDRDELPEYPNKQIHVRVKGISYELCSRFSGDEWAPPSESQMDESLHVMKNQLHCNGLQVMGDCDEVMIACVKTAIGKGFDTIIVSPRPYKKSPSEDNTIDEGIEMVASFAEKLEDLRKFVALVLCVGWEWEISLRGIATSATYAERSYEIYGRYEKDWKKWERIMRPYVEEKLNSYLEQAIGKVRKNFGGKLTYSSGEGTRSLVHWDDLGLDIVGPMIYYAKKYQTPSTIQEELRSFQRYGKPVYVTEFGCFTYQGASLYGGDGWRQYHGQDYSQEEQAQSIMEQVKLFDTAGVDGIFLHSFNFPSGIENDTQSQSLVRGYAPRERKRSFYAYASFRNE